MTREPRAAKLARTQEILRRLRAQYPESKISLEYENEIQLLVAVILSAQCTDAMVNKVTRKLFQTYRTADDFADAPQRSLEKEIHSTGFFRNKARNIRAAARHLRKHHEGRLPGTLAELDAIPGVARKTANVVLWNAFRKAEGIAVDTHVVRIANLLRLTSRKDPVHIERDLVRIVPWESWGEFTHLIIDHGRAICVARRPRCEGCVLNELCPSALRPLSSTLADNASDGRKR